MSYVLGKGSEHQLIGVVPKFVSVIRFAITVTEQDFCVYQGGRTHEQQIANIRKGVSQTMDSMHLMQPDGFFHATDLVPWINGAPVWDWTGCYKIAMAMDVAATQLGVAKNIRWGGAWDQRLNDFGGNIDAYRGAVAEYQRRHPGKDFLDGPHFEWRD